MFLLFSRWLVLINTSHLENSIFFHYSPDEWYWPIPVIWRKAYFFTILQMTGIDRYQSSGGTVFSRWLVLINNTHLENIYFSPYYNDNGTGMARRYWKIPSSSFRVGQYPPRPSASPPDIEEGIAQPLRIWRVFSNTSLPCLGHCHIF